MEPDAALAPPRKPPLRRPPRRLKRRTVVISGNAVGELGDPSEPPPPHNIPSWPLPSNCTALGAENGTKGVRSGRATRAVLCGPRLRTSNQPAPLSWQQTANKLLIEQPNVSAPAALEAVPALSLRRLMPRWGARQQRRRQREVGAAVAALMPEELERMLDEEPPPPSSLELPQLASFDRRALEQIALPRAARKSEWAWQ